MQEQSPWITWVIQSITMLGIGIIGFFIKQFMNQFKSEIARVESQLKTGLTRVEKQLASDVSRVERRVEILEAKHERLPYDFTTNETYIRSYNAFEKKLEKIYDILSDIKGRA